MHHNVILRLAMGLIVVLVCASVAFAWAVNQREQRLAARDALRPSPYSDTSAEAAYEQRCTECHAPQQIADWVARRPASTRETDVLDFLRSHGRAPEAENRLIARLLAQRASGR